MQNDLPLVSVIVPTYNYGSFIREALESVFHQDYPADRIEVIVVDDGSTDDTKEIVQDYLGRIVYSYHDNLGVAAARNKGVLLAAGEIITFLDADDIWYTDRIRKVAKQFRKHAAIGLIYHKFEVIDGEGRIIQNYISNIGSRRDTMKWLLHDIVRGNVFCGGSSFSFAKEIVEKIYPIPEDIKRGVDFYLTAVSSCYARALYIPEILGKYRLHDRNLTFADNNDLSAYASRHRDFSHTYGKLLSRLSLMPSVCRSDLKVVERRYFRSRLFSEVLSGRRSEGVKYLASLFNKTKSFNASVRALMAGVVLLMPRHVYLYAVKLLIFSKRVGKKISGVIKGSDN
jgi:glycosyltransferase involved in cell wall biosynthesis